MACPHLYALEAGCEHAFTVDASRVTFGHGALAEAGSRLRALGATRVALFTDVRLRALPWFAEVERSLRDAGLDVAVFDEVAIEPTDGSLDAAVRFARDTRADGYLSLGGGSVIDTCKVADLLATFPDAALLDHVNAPIGRALAIPRPLAPHLACPTTSGTGSEVTGIAIFDLLALHAKTGIASPRLRPSEALIDPRVTATLPAAVVAASGLDVLCHALESFTARPFTARSATPPAARPMSQGANPWSDLGCREALRLCGAYLARAVRDAADAEAREQMMWAATLAGIAFGNAGVHAPHAMAYAVAGRARGYAAPGYPLPAASALVPHGFAVAVNAPAVFARFAATSPGRHLEAAELLGADVRGAAPRGADAITDAGERLGAAFAAIMRDVGAPNGLTGVGYGADDIPGLVEGAAPQRRLLDNAPLAVTPALLDALFHDALTCW